MMSFIYILLFLVGIGISYLFSILVAKRIKSSQFINPKILFIFVFYLIIGCLVAFLFYLKDSGFLLKNYLKIIPLWPIYIPWIGYSP